MGRLIRGSYDKEVYASFRINLIARVEGYLSDTTTLFYVF